MINSMQFLEANKYLIRYYYIYKYKSFNKASDNFYVSSSDRNMKYAVDQLESFYGVKLIKTSGNKLDFTEFGHILGRESEKIFNYNLDINSIIQRANFKEVRFATSNDFYEYYVKPIFVVFQKENPEIKITLIKTNQFDSTQRILNREIDFIVGSVPIKKNDDLIYQPIAKAKMLLVCTKEKYEIFKNIKSLKELEPYKGAINDSTDPFYSNFIENTQKQEADLSILYYTTDCRSLVNVVLDGYADYSIIGNYKQFDEVSLIDITGLFDPVNIAFIYRKGETPTKIIEKLIEVSKKLNIKPI